MRDVRVLSRWPEWQSFRKKLLESGKISEEQLSALEPTTAVDSLELVELIMSLEEVCGVEWTETPKS
jgi:acyl carrier protein